ncbi:Transcription antitermination factor NusG [Cyclonatronum proteinivorum]|uniref:Transcription antitermination factor NusG n=1 Tax=Cyclonatronum proteinivorum TaxID=1457365 RepID=A0A345UJZ9_9BACT|nr:UpxY family transcription antiterminator [Cyclonatronum proteinivorum]AXJ00801.1 Transcription antitermination factor NusG [Cyclonatronum proteinivorum]
MSTPNKPHSEAGAPQQKPTDANHSNTRSQQDESRDSIPSETPETEAAPDQQEVAGAEAESEATNEADTTDTDKEEAEPVKAEPWMLKSGITLRESSKRPKKEHVLRKIAAKNERPRWYALKTKPRAEKKTDIRLRETGFSSYCPIVKELRKWSDRKKWVEVPLFNGYIFVNTVTSQFSAVLADEGAVHFVKFAGQTSAVPDEQIAFIQKVVENKLRYEVTEVRFEKGDTVEITQGPLKGHTAVWMKKKSKYNVALEIKQLNSVIAVEIPAAFLRKAEQDDDKS